MRRAHLGKDFIQPLQGPVKMNLNPAWGACHILSMVLCTPTLYKAHADGAHLGEFIDGFKTVIDGLSQELSKLLVVEDL